ncbi:MAG: hypothetical protein ACRD0M_05055 [Acidimicrobiales bacterium]
MVASAILITALAVFLGALASTQRTANYQGGRNRALDDLRITADVFAKDARHARRVVSGVGDSVTLETYVGGVLKDVTYTVVTAGGQTNLERVTAASASRLFVIRLTDDSIFRYDNEVCTDPLDPTTCTLPDPSQTRLIRLHMESLPHPNYPPVVLATEVSLRNVSA